MKTKALIRFLNRLAHYVADLELADVVTRSQAALGSGNGRLFDAVDKTAHPTLSQRKDADSSREAALAHLKTTLAQSIIKDLYEDVTAFLQQVLRAAASKGINPARYVGEHDYKIAAKDLLALGSWDEVVRHVSDTIFRRLEEERSTMKLLSLLDTKLGLKIDEAILKAALPYLDARHRFIHHDGRVDQAFAEAYPSLGLSDGDDLPTTYVFVVEAQAAIRALVEEYDRALIASDCLPATELQK